MSTHFRQQSRLTKLLKLTTILSGIASPAIAGAADAVAAPADAAPGFEEIIVTATRSAENVQKVPISIQVLSGDVLSQRQVKGLSDFAALLPSVSFAGIGPGRNDIYFRGIVPAGGVYSATGYYLDDIPITDTAAGFPDIHVFDLERIEALSGPQGTLFGASSLAGTVRFITNKPKLGAFSAGYNVEGNKSGKGNFGGGAEAFVNVPLGETLAARVMGFYRKEGGYIDNVPNNGKLNDGSPAVLTLGDNNPLTSFTLNNAAIAKDNYNPVETYGGRLTLRWEPADGWDITPSIMAQRQIANGYFGFDQRIGDLQVHDYDVTRQDDKWYQASLTIHGHIGDWDVVSATGYHQRQTKLLNDYSYYTVTYDGFGAGYESYLQFFDKSGCTGAGATLKCNTLLDPTQFYSNVRNQRKFTQELRLKTPSSWPFNVTVGGFFQSQHNETNDNYGIHGLSSIVGYTDVGGGDDPNFANTFGVPIAQGGTMVLGSPAVKNDAFYLTEQDTDLKDYAVFAEGHYNIFETLKITGGIRYFWTESARTGFAGVAGSAAGTAATFIPTGAIGCAVPFPAERLQCRNINPLAKDQVGRYKEQGETHKVALDWQVADQKLIYLNYSTGFRPGGFNRPLRIRNVGTAAAPPYEAETLINYEIGVKTIWNNIFRFNAAIYLEKWNDIQYGVVVAGAQGAGFTGNAGNAEVKGIEYDATLKLGEFTIASSGAFNDAKLKGDFCNFAVNTTTLTIAQLSTCARGQTIPGTNTNTPQVAAVDGTRLPRQPRFKGSSSVRYDTDFGGYASYLQVAALYQTGATQDLNETNAALYGDTSGFVSFDFSAGIRKDSWSIDLFINNAFDKRGELTRNTFCSIDFCANSARTFTIRPQFFGIRVGQRFG
ncbi:MAG: TonB-dependent receptor [Alphaproteobacteria bacterium]|nr:MAG: TonB-dependent receptor [Alphaproteobacteria bacterium]